MIERLYDIAREPSVWTTVARDFQAVLHEQQREIDALKLRLADSRATIRQLRERNAELLQAAQQAPVPVPTPPPPAVPGSLAFDSVARRLTLNGVMVDLTKREWQLVALLATMRGRSISYEEIQLRLYGRLTDGSTRHGHSSYHNTTQAVHRLAKKLRQAGIPPDVVCQRVGTAANGAVMMPLEAA